MWSALGKLHQDPNMVLVDAERLEIVLKKSCPPHRKDIHKPCELMIDCAECRRAYLFQREGE